MSRTTKKTEKANPNRAKYRIIFGAFLFFAGLASALACLSFLMHWKSDLSAVNALGESAIAVENIFKSLGLFIGYLIVYKGFGISGTLIPVLFSITGFILFFNLSKRPLLSLWSTGLFWMLWITFLLYLVLDKGSVYAGIVGYEIGEFIELYIGRIGLLFSLLFTGFVYAVIALKWTPSLRVSPLRFPSIRLNKFSFKRFKSTPSKPLIVDESDEVEAIQSREDASLTDESIEIDLSDEPSLSSVQEIEQPETTLSESEPQVAFEIASTDVDELDKKSTKLVEDFGEFDPTLELSNYKAPHIDLLDSHGIEQSQIEIDKEELGAKRTELSTP